MASPYDTLCRLTRETALLQSIEALIGWDERTYMPPAAGEYRAEQMTYLAGMIHQRRTDQRIGELLSELTTSSLTKDKHSDEATTIRQLQRDYEKQVKLPQAL